MPLISCSDDVLRVLRAARAVPLDREAVRFVADLLQQVQAGMVGRQVQHVARGSGNTMSSSAGLALGALGDPDQRRLVQALLGQHLGRDAHLPLPPSITSRSGAGYSPATMRAQRRVSASRIAA